MVIKLSERKSAVKSEVHDLSGNVMFVRCTVGVVQGFLWVRHLQVVLVLRQGQQFQVVQPHPSRHALLWDPVIRIRFLMDARMNRSVMDILITQATEC